MNIPKKTYDELKEVAKYHDISMAELTREGLHIVIDRSYTKMRAYPKQS